MAFRIGIAGLLHESNTFFEGRTTWDDFAAATLTEGDATRRRWLGAHHELGGFFTGCAVEEMEAVPGFTTVAVPGPTIDADSFERLAAIVMRSVVAMGPIDGLLLALHGATVSERYPDADGEILKWIRFAKGDDFPIVVTLDLHANVSEAMVRRANAIVSYRTNPHLDQRDRGLEAAQLMARILRNEVQPVMALESPPMLIPIGAQNTSQAPARGLYEDLEEVLTWPGILSASVHMGFYYADVAEMCASFLAVADGDGALARRAAQWMAQRAWDRRDEFRLEPLAPAAAVAQAMRLPEKPVVLMDIGDNVGGGSPGDSQVLLEECLQQGARNSLIVLHAPAAAARYAQLGPGSTVYLPMGPATVRLVADGRFTEPEPRHGGWTHCDQGLTVVLESEDRHTIVLTTLRMAPFSLRQLTSLGISPSAKDILIVKGVIAPQAAYRQVASHILLVDTPGHTAHNPQSFQYQSSGRSLFPIDPNAHYDPKS